MRPSDPVDFVRSPFGRYVQGPTYLSWCHDEALCGTVFWGTPDASDVLQVTRLFEMDRHPQMGATYDVVCDGRRVERVDAAAFGALATYMAGRVPEWRKRLRRSALVTPAGLVGAAMNGLFPLLGARHAWKGFDHAEPAFGWLGREDGRAVLTVIEGLVGEATGSPVLLRRLRGAIANDLAGARLPTIAAELGVSVRSLQRALEGHGSTFRREVTEARLREAGRRLADTDDKLEAIARAIGFASLPQLSTAFRRATGQTPSDFRAKRRA